VGCLKILFIKSVQAPVLLGKGNKASSPGPEAHFTIFLHLAPIRFRYKDWTEELFIIAKY
jgi:hypothetical protein